MKYKLQPLHEALIYIEEKQAVKLEDFNSWGKNVSRGIVGKMEAMGLVKRVKEGSSTTIELSPTGYDFLNHLLDTLHNETVHWDGKWRMVWFSVSEKKRSYRDKLRRHLEFLGMRPVLNSLWISPLPVSDDVLSRAKKLEITSSVAVVETDQISGISKEEILCSWDFEGSRKMFYEFIDKYSATKFEGLDSFSAKKIIFEYALILKREPKLPIELFPADWPRYRADQIYKKVKKQIG
jgi:phenylacetic acid degradation operon negative regulatory protein